MKIGVVGAGAVGLYYGAKLQQGGQDLHFVLRRDYDAIMEGGLHVQSVRGDFHLPKVQGYRHGGQIGPVDLVLVGLKADAAAPLADLVGPLIGPKTMVLTLQNGLGNEERLAARFGAERVIGGTAFLCSNRGQPGTVHHLDHGHIQIAEYAQAGFTDRLTQLAETFSGCDIPCQAKPDLTKIRWKKLVWNIPFNGLCALTGKTTSELLAHEPSRLLATEIMREVLTASKTQGLTTPLDEDFAEQLIAITERMHNYRPSMMIDRVEGRPLELEAIYREPLRRARAQGVTMPCTEMLWALLDLGEPRAPRAQGA